MRMPVRPPSWWDKGAASSLDGPWLDPVPKTLRVFLDATAIGPSRELADRVDRRISLEPPSTAPRRFLVALRVLDARGVVRGVRQCAGDAVAPGARSMVHRAQAMTVALAAVATIGSGSVLGLAGARAVVDELGRRATSGQARPISPPAPGRGHATVPGEAADPSGASADAGSPNPGDGGLRLGVICDDPASGDRRRSRITGSESCPPWRRESTRRDAEQRELHKPRHKGRATDRAVEPDGRGKAADQPAKKRRSDRAPDPPRKAADDGREADRPAKPSGEAPDRTPPAKSRTEPARERE